MLTTQQLADAVDILHNAEQARVQVPALTLSYPEMDLEDAYAVQKGWVESKQDNRSNFAALSRIMGQLISQLA